MKILLFGEYSGLFNCLKHGLQALGHEVFLASEGNGYKNYPSDFRWDSNLQPKLGKAKTFYYAANIWLHKDLLKGYDVVYIISPDEISRFKWLNAPIYNYLIRHNKKVYLCGAGMTPTVFDYWYESDTKYKSYMEGYFWNGAHPKYYHNYSLKSWEDELIKKIDGYIPIWYEYAQPFRQYDTLKDTIRIPINLDQFEYKRNRPEDKIVFFHGVTRECKGTRRFIKPAFEKMQKIYGDKAEFICAGGLPFDEYMRVIDRANVIVDDANSFSIAMNGLFSLLKGKLVVGGAEPEGNKELGYLDSPVFNINPNIDNICEVLASIIDRRNEIEDLGYAGRKFVEKYHNSLDIAQQYVDLWESDLKK